MKPATRAVSVLAAGSILLAGCASTASAPHTTAKPREMPPGMVMPDGSTMAPGSPGTAPSDAAKMICTDETRQNMATVLAVPLNQKPASTWKGGTYTCTYRLPMGPIVLSVRESADDAAASTYTAAVRQAMPAAKKLTGLAGAAFGTADGVVVVQKDNDTLRVDTSGLRRRSDRLYAHRDEFAYEIAAVVMSCWTGSPAG